VISRGPDNTDFISTYQSRNNPKYLSSLGQAIVEIARRVPDGLLVA
jgi:regulator of telomere elongation helicase 1